MVERASCPPSTCDYLGSSLEYICTAADELGNAKTCKSIVSIVSGYGVPVSYPHKALGIETKVARQKDAQWDMIDSGGGTHPATEYSYLACTPVHSFRSCKSVLYENTLRSTRV